MAILGATACSSSAPATNTTSTPARTPAAADRPYLLERVDEAAIAQLYADGFTDLSLKDKKIGRAHV